MILPIFLSHFFIQLTLSILSFYIRLGFYTIEILMKAIQQKSKEFLRIMLIKATELRSKTSKLRLKCSWCHWVCSRSP
uniref:Uncharacterized protein n=1 Tax=Rhizophora mucronata TaxID=61149 RepID=A0A2P2J7F6_RHIMU